MNSLTGFWKIAFFLFCLPLAVFSQDFQDILPDQRQTTWMTAGLVTPFNTNASVNVMDYGAIPNGNVDISPIMANVLDALGPDGGIILFPEGNYLFRNPIHLPSNITLRGQGTDKTTLTFDLFEPVDAIKAAGEFSFEFTEILESIPKGGKIFIVMDASNFEVGDYVLIQDNDSDLVTSSWANNTTGQINQITYIDGNTIRLKSPMRRPFQLSRDPKMFPLEMVENIGIENLKIVREDQTSEKNSNIYFDLAVNCWVECIESDKCNFAHFEATRSTNLQVTGSYFHHAFNYGGGGKAYGVMLHYNTGECLIENNVFKRLRHSMILQAGANGNVFAYNYSTDPYWTEVGLPPNAAGDIVLHGNFPYSNLFEGNIAQNIVLDDSHGTHGPYNTFFRNRAEGFGILMSAFVPTDKQNFIGNEVTGGLGIFYLAGDGHFSYGNNVLGQILPDPTNILDDTTYYSSTPDAFYLPGMEEHPIGIPNDLEEIQSIAAKERYVLDMIIHCDAELPNPPPTPTSVAALEDAKTEVQYFPNPSHGILNIEASHENLSSIEVYNLQGQLIQQHRTSAVQYQLNNLPNGLLLIRVQLENGQVESEKIWVMD